MEYDDVSEVLITACGLCDQTEREKDGEIEEAGDECSRVEGGGDRCDRRTRSTPPTTIVLITVVLR